MQNPAILNHQVMIRRNGPQKLENIHVTVDLPLEDLIDIDNSNAQGIQLDTFGVLNQTSKDINDLIQEAKTKKKPTGSN